ncbi:hypothetical protein TIFTF001_031532 [Ficus carica]|uniref:Uncharacterized protein n=1 Tax=Ficus carica TaxID=3494 RepID=A0AA88DVF3_FICCA|nr:hypothetical protein TIFTF001_031532 [Ficus carica]
MSCPCTRANPIPQEPDLANIVATLQRQLREQQQETNQLREQVAQLNQISQTNKVPSQNNLIPLVAPQVLEVRQEVPLASTGLQRNPPLVREDLLYERFRRMKAPEFEGLTCNDPPNVAVTGGYYITNPIEADNWLIDIQVILDFMGLIEHEKVLCASFALKKDARHWWMTVQMQLVPNETEKVRRMMKIFRTDIAKQVSAGSSPPTLVADCISRALRAEYWINQDKEARAQIFKAKKEERVVVKQSQPRQNQELYLKGQTSNSGQNFKQFGKNKRKGNATSQGQQRKLPLKEE